MTADKRANRRAERWRTVHNVVTFAGVIRCPLGRTVMSHSIGMDPAVSTVDEHRR